MRGVPARCLWTFRPALGALAVGAVGMARRGGPWSASRAFFQPSGRNRQSSGCGLAPAIRQLEPAVWADL